MSCENIEFTIVAETEFTVKLVSKYEGRLISSWTDCSAPLLFRGRRWLLCQVVVVGVT